APRPANSTARRGCPARAPTASSPPPPTAPPSRRGGSACATATRTASRRSPPPSTAHSPPPAGSSPSSRTTSSPTGRCGCPRRSSRSWAPTCCGRTERGPVGRRRLQSLAAAAAVSLPLLAAGCSSDGAEPAVGTGTAVPDTSTATSTAPGSASGSASTGGSAAPGADAGVHLLGSVTVPTGMRFEGTTVGGLSGIDYDPDSGHYVVISDDRGAHGPTRAYTLELPLDGQGRPGQPR